MNIQCFQFQDQNKHQIIVQRKKELIKLIMFIKTYGSIFDDKYSQWCIRIIPFVILIFEAMSNEINVQVCGVCKFNYDSKVRAPMILCPQQHICCQNCYDRLLSKEGSVCPDCQHPIDKENVAKFRLYPKFESRMAEIHQKHAQKVASTKNSLLPIISQIIAIKRKGKEKEFDEHLKAKVKQLMKKDRYAQVIPMLKALIENNGAEAIAEDFIGLGCDEAGVGLCEEANYEWYEKQRGESKQLSMFDKIAICFQKEKNYDEAREFYNRMQKQCPQSYQTVFGVAVVDQNAGKLEVALQHYAVAININPSFAQSYAMSSLIHFSLKQFEQALKYAKEAIEREKVNIFAQFVYALTNQPSNLEKIRENLAEAIKIQPNYVRAINSIGQTFFKEDSLEQAKEQFDKCITINKTFAEPHINLGKVLLSLRKYDETIDRISAVMHQRLTPKQESECFYTLGLAHKAIEQHKIALRWFHSFQDMNTGEPSVHIELAQIQCSLKDFKMAANMCRAYLSAPTADKKAERWSMYEMMTAAYIELKDDKSAIEWLQKWREEFPEDSEIILQTANYLLSTEKFEEALTIYRECLQNSFQTMEVYSRMIEALSHLQKKTQILSLIEEYKQKCELDNEEMERIEKLENGIRNGEGLKPKRKTVEEKKKVEEDKKQEE